MEEGGRDSSKGEYGSAFGAPFMLIPGFLEG